MNSEFRFRLTVNLIDAIVIVILIILMCLTSSFDCAVQSQSPATNEQPFGESEFSIDLTKVNVFLANYI